MGAYICEIFKNGIVWRTHRIGETKIVYGRPFIYTYVEVA